MVRVRTSLAQPTFIQYPFLAVQPLAAVPQAVQPEAVQPFAETPEAPVVQRVGNGEAFHLPPALPSFGGASGQPLPGPMRQKMESFFGNSFADVRVHVGPQASSIGARAFAHGSNLYFAPGHYNPSTAHGQQLLGHELTHVVQQRAGRVRNPFGLGVAVVQDHDMEAEADRMGLRVAATRAQVQANALRPFCNGLRSPGRVVQRSLMVGDEPQESFEAIKFRLADNEYIGWDEEWRAPLERALTSKAVIKLQDDRALEEYLMNSVLHNEVAESLGAPLNWKEFYGNKRQSDVEPEETEVRNDFVKDKIWTALKEARKADLGDDLLEENGYKWLIFYAASALVTGAAVCDNYASLVAVKARISGRDDVYKMHTGNHAIAGVGSMEIDPWKDFEYANKPATGQRVITIEQEPGEVQSDLEEEIKACREAFDAIMEGLSPQERQQYEMLIQTRAGNGWGSLQWRQTKADEEQEAFLARMKALEEKKALKKQQQ